MFPSNSPLLLALAARPQDVTVAAHRVNQFHGIGIVNLSAQAGNVHLNDVAEFFQL